MRMDKLTNQLQTALADAQSLALGKDHNFIEPVHLLSALLEQRGGACRPLLQKAGADVAGLAARTKAAIDALPTVTGTAGDVHMSNDLVRILNVTDKLAQQGGDTYISSELVLLAMLESKTSAGDLMKASGLRPLDRSPSKTFPKMCSAKPSVASKSAIPSSSNNPEFPRRHSRS